MIRQTQGLIGKKEGNSDKGKQEIDQPINQWTKERRRKNWMNEWSTFNHEWHQQIFTERGRKRHYNWVMIWNKNEDLSWMDQWTHGWMDEREDTMPIWWQKQHDKKKTQQTNSPWRSKLCAGTVDTMQGGGSWKSWSRRGERMMDGLQRAWGEERRRSGDAGVEAGRNVQQRKMSSCRRLSGVTNWKYCWGEEKWENRTSAMMMMMMLQRNTRKKAE